MALTLTHRPVRRGQTAPLSIVLVLVLLAGCVGGIAEFNGPDAPRFVPYREGQRPHIARSSAAAGRAALRMWAC